MRWFDNEFKQVNFGDERLNKRLLQLADKLSQNSTESIPKACNHWAEIKAAYRFFDNKKVTSEKLLQPHKEAAQRRISEEKIVLLIQDTTELNYSGQEKKDGTGPGKSENNLTLNLHPLIAVTPEKMCLGIIDNYSWCRKELHRKTKTKKEINSKNMHLPIEEKESFRWLEGYRKSCEIAMSCPTAQIVCVADRESDIFDIFHEEAQCNSIKANWLIRSRINRALCDSDGRRKSHLLHEEIARCPVVETMQIELPARNKQKARTATVQVKIKPVVLHPPTGRRGKLRLQPAASTFIKVEEINPPKQEEAIDWLLLTNLHGDSFDDAKTFINWYICRWQIEIFFKILKSGCTIEKLQLTKPERFLPCITLYMVIAWRILFLTMKARNNPLETCENYFSIQEWSIAYIAIKKFCPASPPPLHDIIKIIAQLGGHIARKNDGPPGVKTIWLGLRDLAKMVLGAECAAINSKATYG